MSEHSMREVKTPADIPEGPHFAVLVYKTESQHIPGDPGHGCLYTTTTTTYEHWVTCDEPTLQTKVTELSAVPRFGGNQPVFAVLKVERKLAVKTTTTVDIG